jgi:hypothetical protein
MNPQHYAETYNNVTLDGDTSGSAFSAPTELSRITILFLLPLHYNAQALPTTARLITKQSFSRHIDFIPYNNDKFCFFHCIYNHLFTPNVKQYRSLNSNEIYMKAFNKWAEENKIEEFYHKNFFLIDDVPQIEERLKISINVYRQFDSEVELFYRSDYKHCGEKMNQSTSLSRR